MKFFYRFSPLRIPFPIRLIALGRFPFLRSQAEEAKEAEHSAIAPALRLWQPAALGLGSGQQHSLRALQALRSNNCR